MYKGFDDGGHLYALPPQFYVTKGMSLMSEDMVLFIYEKGYSEPCRLVSYKGMPAIIDSKGNRIPLKRSGIDQYFHL